MNSDTPLSTPIVPGNASHEEEMNEVNLNGEDGDPNMPYLSSQLMSLFQFQNLLTQQLNNARQEVQHGDNDVTDRQNGSDSVSLTIHDQHNTSNNTSTTSDIEHLNALEREQEAFGGGSSSSSSSSSSSLLDWQMGARWLEQATVFIGLLLILGIYQHRHGILVFIFNTIVFTHANQSLKKQVSLKDKRNIRALVGIVLFLLSHLLFMYLFLRADRVWYSLALVPPKEPIDIWTVFWIIFINDFFVRFFTMMVKACVVIAVGHKSPHKRKAQLYTIIEMSSYTYRTILPVPLWFQYFYTFDENGQLFSSLMAGLYLACKFINMVDRFRIFFATVKAYVLREVKFGHYASLEQVAEAGDQCPICQEKMISPIALRCSHLFCEDCVTEWFERERTCPLCRASVPTAGNRTHADGSTSVLVQLF